LLLASINVGDRPGGDAVALQLLTVGRLPTHGRQYITVEPDVEHFNPGVLFELFTVSSKINYQKKHLLRVNCTVLYPNNLTAYHVYATSCLLRFQQVPPSRITIQNNNSA